VQVAQAQVRTMLVRTDPFGEFDRLVAQQGLGTMARPAAMPMDAWRDGEQIVVEFDLPGVDPGSVDLDATCSPSGPSVARQPGRTPK
jgi:HSP20 family protein